MTQEEYMMQQAAHQARQQEIAKHIPSSTPLECEECKNQYFNEVTHFRKISKLLLGEDKDQMIPIPTYACSKCGHVNKDFEINVNNLK